MKHVNSERNRDLLALAVVAAVIVICFRDILFGTHSWAYDGATDRYYSAAFFAALARQSATWRMIQDVLAGFPMYNNGNFSPYYPFYVLWPSFYSDQLGSLKFMDRLELFHLVLAGCLTFAGLRLLNLHRLAAMMGGLSFILSPYALKMATWLHFTAAYAWVPLALMGILAVSTGDRRPIAMMAVVLSGFMAVLAYPAQAAVHLLIAGPLVTLVGLWAAAHEGSLFKPAARIVVAALVLALLSAPILLPLVFPDQAFIRWFTGERLQVGGGGVPSEFLFQGSIAPADLPAILLPTVHRAFIGDIYIGIPLALLCLAAFRFNTRKQVKIGLLILITAWTIVLLGDYTNAGHLIEHIPFVNQVRNPPRHMPILLTFVIVLAAFGLDDLLRVARGGRLGQFISPVSLTVVVLAAFVMVALIKTGSPYAIGGLPGALFILASLLCLWLVCRPSLVVAYAAVAATVAIRVSSPLSIYPLEYNRITRPPLATVLEDLHRSAATTRSSDGRLIFFGGEFAGAVGLPMLALGSGAANSCEFDGSSAPPAFLAGH